MRPAAGIVFELAALAAALQVGPLLSPGPYFMIYVIAAQILSTYLIHCPAHYIVGTALGIKFRRIKVARSTLSKSLTPRFAIMTRLFIVPTLSTDKASMSRASAARSSAMYASGTIASVASALVIALIVTMSQPLLTYALAWLVAFGYLLFNVVFSPRTGDLMRARIALARS